MLFNFRRIIFAQCACPACSLRWRDKGFHVFAQRRKLCPVHQAQLDALFADASVDRYSLLYWTQFRRQA